jgi:hypothetical protein
MEHEFIKPKKRGMGEGNLSTHRVGRSERLFVVADSYAAGISLVAGVLKE